MFVSGRLLINPSDPVTVEQNGTESETFSTSRILQQITRSLRSAGIRNAVQLSHDGSLIYLDETGTTDDLTAAVREFALRSTAQTRNTFDTLRLVLEHETRLLRFVIDVQIERVHSITEFAIAITLVGFMKEFSTVNGVLTRAQQELLDEIFHDQAGHDAIVRSAGEDCQQLLGQLSDAVDATMSPEQTRMFWTPQILSNEAIPESVPDSWRSVFDHPSVTLDDVVYCYSWYPTGNAYGLSFDGQHLLDSGVLRGSEPNAQVPLTMSGNPFVGLTLSLDDIPRFYRSPTGTMLHRPSEIWQAVADVSGCSYRVTGPFSTHSLAGKWNGYVIHVKDDTSQDEDEVGPATLIRAAFHGRFGFKGQVSQDGFVRRAFRPLWGGQDIEIGEKKFDEEYVVSGDARPMKHLLASDRIRALIQEQPWIELSVAYTSILIRAGSTHPDKVLRLFELMIEILTQINVPMPDTDD